MSGLAARSLLTILVALILSWAVGLDPACAQVMATVSGWGPAARVDPTADPSAIATRTAPIGLPGVEISVQAKCVNANAKMLFSPTLMGAAFDGEADTLVRGSTGMFGSVHVYSNTYKYIGYQWRIDSQPWELGSYTVIEDTAGHTFGALVDAASLVGKSRLQLVPASNGRKIFIQIDLKHPLLANYIRSCVTTSRDYAAKQEAQDRAETAAARRQDAQEKADQRAKVNTDVLNQRLDSFTAAFGHGPIPEEAKIYGEGGVCASIGLNWHVVLKTTQPTEFLQQAPVYLSTGYRPPNNRVLGTLPAGQMFDYDPCGAPADNYATVGVIDGDPWLALNHYRSGVGGAVAVAALGYGNAKEWQAYKAQTQASVAAASKAALEKLHLDFANAVTPILGPIPAGASECSAVSINCAWHLISFKAVKDTYLIWGEPTTSIERYRIPAGSHLCSLDISQINGAYVYLKCGANAVVVLADGGAPDWENQIFGGWVAINTLAYDVDHPKHK